MKKILLFMAMMMATSCFAQAPRYWPTFMDENGNMVNLSASQPLPIDGINVSSITVEAFPVYSDASGNPATATVDASNRAIVNLGSESIGLVNAVKQCTEWHEQYVALSANTAATFTTEISGSRRFVELTSQDQDIEFWVSFGGTAVIGQCRPVNGSVYVEIPKDVVVSMIASEDVSISIVEGGY